MANDTVALTTDGNNGWIKCKDRLPPYNKEVLVYMGSSVYLASRHHTDSEGEWFDLCPSGSKKWNTVTHWMPVPGKPNEF